MKSDLVGKRVRLEHSGDLYTSLRPGDEGQITSVDDLGTVHVNWDNGVRLGLVAAEDRWEVLDG